MRTVYYRKEIQSIYLKTFVLDTTDGNGNTTAVACDGSGNQTTYTYDLLYNQISRTNAQGETGSYSYDLNNCLEKVTCPNGKTIQYDYNKLVDFFSGKESCNYGKKYLY